MKQAVSCHRIQAFLTRKNGDNYGATIEYRREVGGHTISVNPYLTHLYPFMGVEKTEPQEQIRGLDKDKAAAVIASSIKTILFAFSNRRNR